MGFAEKLKSLLGLGKHDEELYDALCDLLIEGDVGASLAFETVERLRTVCAKERIREGTEIRKTLKKILAPYARTFHVSPPVDSLGCLLALGVNGVGKTTTVAKLAAHLRALDPELSVLLAAGDTFRAAAIDQLKIHGQRLGLRVVAQEHGADPGAVLFDALEAAKADGTRLVIADSAGRMHTKQNLVRELAKIDKIVSARVSSSNYIKLLVVDATTGQNALAQAATFKEAVSVDALVLTKYDSTAKGGIVLTAAHDLGLPTAFIGFGERYGDIAPFNPETFLDDFLGLS